jgi:hypothetical protein
MIDQPIRIRINGVLVEDMTPAEPRTKYNHWRPLHEYRGCDRDWLARWVAGIPSAGCRCAAGYQAFIATDPPDFSSPEALFAWGIRLHNWVNAKINSERNESRRIYSLEDAYREWWPEMLAA